MINIGVILAAVLLTVGAYAFYGGQICLASIARADQLHGLSKVAMQAYNGRDPTHAIRELNRLAEHLREDLQWTEATWMRRRWSFHDISTLNFDLGLTEARLAKKYAEVGNETDSQAHMERAKRYLNQRMQRVVSDRDAMALLSRIDRQMSAR